jgi:hypothetical protein
MKKILAFALAAVVALSSCEKGEQESQISLSNQEDKTQAAFADDETTGGGFTFVAKSAWTASVAETTATRAAGVEWLRLLLNGEEAYSGDAGEITLAIELEPNYTSTDRSASITISSGGTGITISVTQAGMTREGEIPPGPPEEKREIAFDGQTIPVVRTEFEEGVAYTTADGVAMFRHTMWFYTGENTWLKLLFVTAQRTLANGTYTAGDPSNLTSGKVEGAMNFINATGASDNLQAGSTVTVERRADGAYAVSFSGATVGANKPIAMQFTGTMRRPVPTPVTPSGERKITCNGKSHDIIKTEFGTRAQGADGTANGGTGLYIHTMTFYTTSRNCLHLSLTDSNQSLFVGGTVFTLGGSGDKSATGTINFTTATGVTENLIGGTVRVVRNADNVIEVVMTGAKTASDVPVTLDFKGEYKNTNYGGSTDPDPDFVPVQSISFAQANHALRLQQAELNSTHSLSGAVVYPSNATNQKIEWSAEGATININATGNTVTFDQEGTAIVTATIRKGTMSGDFRMVAVVRVGYDPDRAVTFDGVHRPIVSTDFTVGQYVNGTYYHRMKFLIDGPRGVDITFNSDNAQTVATGPYSLVDFTPGDGQALAMFNFTKADGTADYPVGGNVRVYSNPDGEGTIRVMFDDIISKATGLPVGMIYAGEYKPVKTK